MIVKQHINTLYNSVCYALGHLLIDPGDEWSGFEGVRAILLTHAHFDHIYGLNEVLVQNPDARVFTNAEGRRMLVDAKLNLSKYHGTPFTFDVPDHIVVVANGEEVQLDEDMVAKAIYTPGHNPSCITWAVGCFLFTGDSYIPGLKTVSNLPKGNKKQALESENIILKLAENKIIYPGHYIE